MRKLPVVNKVVAPKPHSVGLPRVPPVEVPKPKRLPNQQPKFPKPKLRQGE